MNQVEKLPEGYQWKVCPRCQTRFMCGHDSPLKDCGCRQIKLAKPHFSFLFANYKNCLCHDCLRELSQLNEEELKSAAVHIERD